MVFCGTFEAKGLDVAMEGGRLSIRVPGSVPKLVAQVRHISFSGEQARARGQQVLYITERAVFGLSEHGIELREVAPGVNIERDLLARMGFTPLPGQPALMPLD